MMTQVQNTSEQAALDVVVELFEDDRLGLSRYKIEKTELGDKPGIKLKDGDKLIGEYIQDFTSGGIFEKSNDAHSVDSQLRAFVFGQLCVDREYVRLKLSLCDALLTGLGHIATDVAFELDRGFDQKKNSRKVDIFVRGAYDAFAELRKAIGCLVD